MALARGYAMARHRLALVLVDFMFPIFHISQRMTKQNGMCAQRRLRSA